MNQDTIELPVTELTEEQKAEKMKHETTIDIDAETKMMHVQINLLNGPVNAYGTLQYAMEHACRYFTTLEILRRKAEQENASRIIVPGRK